MKDRHLRLRELLVGHRSIRGAEVDGTFQHLSDAAAAPDRLIVYLCVRLPFVKLVEPFGVEWVRKGRSRTVHQQRGPRRNRATEDDTAQYRQTSLRGDPHHSILR